MLISLLKSKLHRARVTDANVDYEGSLTISEDLMELVGILPYERLLVSNMKNGNRFETYAIVGERGKGHICLNGAAAHLGKVGDLLTIMTFAMIDSRQAGEHKPRTVTLGPDNRPLPPKK